MYLNCVQGSLIANVHGLFVFLQLTWLVELKKYSVKYLVMVTVKSENQKNKGTECYIHKLFVGISMFFLTPAEIPINIQHCFKSRHCFRSYPNEIFITKNSVSNLSVSFLTSFLPWFSAIKSCTYWIENKHSLTTQKCQSSDVL